MEDKFSKTGQFYSVFLYVKSRQASLKNSNFQKATAAAPAAAAATGADADAQDLLRHESVPLDDDGDDDSSMAMYEEANTWSEDEEGNIV